MRERLKRMGRAASALAIAAGLVSQGCILEKKTIIDAYTAVHPVPAGVQVLVNTMTFGASYCIPPGEINLNVKLKQFEVAMTALLVTAIYTPVIGDVLVQSFPLPGKKGKFKGKFETEEFCVNPGDKLEWFAAPVGGAILPGPMVSTLKYKALQ